MIHTHKHAHTLTHIWDQVLAGVCIPAIHHYLLCVATMFTYIDIVSVSMKYQRWRNQAPKQTSRGCNNRCNNRCSRRHRLAAKWQHIELENNKIEIARSGVVVGLSDYLLASRNFPPAVMAAAAGERATNIVALALAWIALGLIFGHNPTVASDQRRSMLLIGETAMDMTRT